MAYADRRQCVRHTIVASIADNTDLKFITVPAGKEIELYGMKSCMRTVSPTSNAKIELVDSSNNILLSVGITTTNSHVFSQSQTVPVTFRNSSASDSFLKLRTDQATGTGADGEVEVFMSEPGVK